MNTPLWFSNLAFWSVQVALLVLAAEFLARFLQIRQPHALLAYWRSLLAISLLLPFVQPWHRIPGTGAITIAPDFDAVRLFPASTSVAAHWHFPTLQLIVQILGVVILAGIAARFVVLALGLLKLRQFRRLSFPIPQFVESDALVEEMRARIGARVQFRLSPDVDSPVTFGFLMPVVLLPERFPSLDPRFQSAIACHELLHVRRHDWAHHLTEEIIRAVFWFHPAIAWLISRVRLAREQVVDLEVVRLTNARKPYLEALLEFTTSRTRIAAIPAPPFLAERQLAERISLMLQEVRMSRTRLIASFAFISLCLGLVVSLAVWTFPLKASPRSGQKPQSGIQGGVSEGVTQGVPGGATGGVPEGIEGGINGDLAKHQTANEPNVDYSTIWLDTVKRGPMIRQVRGLGTLVRSNDSASLIARIALPEGISKGVSLNQNAAIATQKGPLAKGHVSSISSEVSNGTVGVDIALDGRLPDAAKAGLQVDGTIDVEKLDNILIVGRPVRVAANSTSSLFKITNDGAEAVKVSVRFGRSSVSMIEVLDGLQVGDKVILSDMSSYDNADHIHLIDDQHRPNR